MGLSFDRGIGRPAHFALIGCMTLATSCSSALAGDRETWRCETPNGQYQQNFLPMPAKATSVSGRINVHKGDFSGKWGSLARINLAQGNGEGGSCHCAGLLVMAFHNPDVIEFHVAADGQDEVISARYMETPITFKIAVNPQGMMTVQVGKDTPVIKTVPLLHTKHDTVSMSCSGADVSFLNISME